MLDLGQTITGYLDPVRSNIFSMEFNSPAPEEKGQNFVKHTPKSIFFLRKVLHFHSTHWGRVTHICVGKLTNIGADNGLSPGRRQAIIWTNAGILLIGPLGKNFSEILIKISTLSFKKMRLKVSSAKWRPFCLDLNVLNPTEVCSPSYKSTSMEVNI